MCSLYPMALQCLQDARPLDIFCISSNSTIIAMHDAGFSPKVQQPMRKMLSWLRVANREEGVWLVPPCLH